VWASLCVSERERVSDREMVGLAYQLLMITD
jgi:hypothetical protein